MKKILMVVVMVMVSGIAWGQASDHRISDNDGDVLGITAGGSVLGRGRSIVTGKNSISAAGTAEVLAGAQEVISITLKGGNQNLGVIYVGNSGVSSSSMTLDTGEVIEISTDNLSDIYIDASGGGNVNSVEYIGIVP